MVLGVLLNHVSGSLEFVLSCFYGIKIGVEPGFIIS